MARAKRRIVPGGGDAHVTVLRMLANKFRALALEFPGGDFHRTLDTPELRKAYIELRPHQFARTFGFERNSHEHYPAASDHGAAVFRRWKIVDFLQESPTRREKAAQLFDGFDPPDLRSVPHSDRDRTVALARARWWIECRLPVLEMELAWLKHHVPELLAATRKCPRDDGSWDRDHDPVPNDGRLYK
jgi:hypothetical protein